MSCLPNPIFPHMKSTPTSKLDAAINHMRSSSNGLPRQSTLPNTSMSTSNVITSVRNIEPANAAVVANSSPKALPNILCKPSSNILSRNKQSIIRSSPSPTVVSRDNSSEYRPPNQRTPVATDQQAEVQKKLTPTSKVPLYFNASISPKDSPYNMISPQGSQASAQKSTIYLQRPNIKVTPKRKCGPELNRQPTNSNNSMARNISQGISTHGQLVINRSIKPSESLPEESNSKSVSSMVPTRGYASTSANKSVESSPNLKTSIKAEHFDSTVESHVGIDLNNSNIQTEVSNHSESLTGSSTEKLVFEQPTSSQKKVKQNTINIPFIWDDYLKATGSIAAPLECFQQNRGDLTCKFEIGMKLETRDPRNMSSWCLATIIRREGIRIQLRLDGSGNSNDFWQLIDSCNIRPVGTIADGKNNKLAPPVGFTSCCSSYNKWIEKRIAKPGVVMAPGNFFEPEPEAPPCNLFKRGMKLEAVDKKNSYLICPATVGDILGDQISVVFDGWKGSFDYRCPYYSRDIFPVGWCHRTGYTLQRPGNWPFLLDKLPSPKVTQTNIQNEPKPETTFTSQESKKKKISFQEPIEEFAPAFFSCRRTTPITDWNLPKKSEKEKAATGLDFQSQNLNPTKLPSASTQTCSQTGKRKRGRPKTNERPKKKSKRTKKMKFKPSNVHKSSENPSMAPKQNEFTTTEAPVDHQKSINPSVSSPEQEPKNQDITSMSVEDVITHILRKDDILAKHVNAFIENEIDGKSFMLLTQDCMSKDLGLKLGPILKIKHLQKELVNKKY